MLGYLEAMADLQGASDGSGQGPKFLTDAWGMVVWVAVALVVLELIRVGIRKLNWVLFMRRDAAQLVAYTNLRAGMRLTIYSASDPSVVLGRGEIAQVGRRSLGILMPVWSGSIHVGTPIQIVIADETAAYQIDVAVQDRRPTGQGLELFVKCPGYVRRVQRREFFRTPVVIPTVLSVVDGLKESRPIAAQVEDLSGGGVGLKTSQEIEAGSRIRVKLPLVRTEEMRAETTFYATVIRSRPDENLKHFHAQCEFADIQEETRNLLVSYCFDVQREWLRERKQKRAA